MFILCLFSILTIHVNGQQFVTIPDSSFARALTMRFPNCMTGNQLDTSCTEIKMAGMLNVSHQAIRDLTGVQYFKNIQELGCSGNLLTWLPPLGKKIIFLDCSYNALTSLPALPNALCTLDCRGNKLKTIPTLPIFMDGSIHCQNNELTALPELPERTSYLDCSNNKITCFPTLPNCHMNLWGNPFTCLPNYSNLMETIWKAYPICRISDSVNNPHNCLPVPGITGYVYKEDNSDCKKDISELALANISVKLYDSINQLIAQTYSLQDGFYQFLAPLGKYRVAIDTAGLPFHSVCKVDTTVLLTTSFSYLENLNFGLTCTPGIDIGIQSIRPQGTIFPGQTHPLRVVAGTTEQLFNTTCSGNNISGQVKITVTGPVKYVNVQVGALIPAINGNVFTYTINDFKAIKANEAFYLNFLTDTTAQAGNSICVDVVITSTVSNKVKKQTKHFCYQVGNSFDPNLKEVYPFNFIPEGFSDWLTYTIHFQNTGNAPAINIVLRDTLSKELDLETFQLMSYSHYNETRLVGNAVKIKFPGIYLTDSASNPEASKGFVQYRIKPKANLPVGTTINNKAFIYFDYNPPIITNTTVNTFVKNVSVDENDGGEKVKVYPNPGNGNYTLEIPGMHSESYGIEIYNVLGSIVYSEKTTTDVTVINLTHQPKGVYFMKITGKLQFFNQRLIKQ